MPYNGVEPYGNGHCHRNCRYRGSPVSDPFYERIAIKTPKKLLSHFDGYGSVSEGVQQSRVTAVHPFLCMYFSNKQMI